MNSPIWRLAGVGLLCLSLSAQTLADDNDQRGPQNRPEGGGQNRAPQQEQRGQQQERGQQVQQQMQQQVQQQQRAQQQEQRGQQQQMQQQVQQQQRELRGQQQEQQRGQQQQQQQTQWQQRQQEFNQRQAQRVQEQQSHGPQVPASQPGRDNGPAIQGKPGVVWQTQPPIRGNNEGPRGDYGPGRGNDGRGPGGHGNGWGPGPQYRPGYSIDRFPDHEYRVPYRGQDFFYSGGYWYRPQGPRYVVVTPPYGIRTRQLPDYAMRMWIGGAMFFLAAGTYYQYMDDSQDYVVVNPPQGIAQSQPQPVQGAQPLQGDGIDVTFYPDNGQSPSQMERDRYDCQRYAAQQSGFDPATATYAPADSVAYLYRQNMGNCLVGRGYQVN